MALAAVHLFRNLDIPFPGAIYAGTPWADLTKTGDTLYSNQRLDRDLFLSDVALTHRKLRESDVVAELHVYEGLSHAGYLISPDTPESLNMYRELDAFINRFLD